MSWPVGKCVLRCIQNSIRGSSANGCEVVLNDSFSVVMARTQERSGEVVTFRELLKKTVAEQLSSVALMRRVCELSEDLAGIRLRAGEHVLMDPRSGLLLERDSSTRDPKSWSSKKFRTSVTAISAVLDSQIETIQDAVELPYLHADLFKQHDLSPPGILLYGPPGCGKTLIAKAVANSLAKRVSERSGKDTKSYFLNVKGPELLNKYVGETERQIRLIFGRARESPRRAGHRLLR